MTLSEPYKISSRTLKRGNKVMAVLNSSQQKAVIKNYDLVAELASEVHRNDGFWLLTDRTTDFRGTLRDRGKSLDGVKIVGATGEKFKVPDLLKTWIFDIYSFDSDPKEDIEGFIRETKPRFDGLEKIIMVPRPKQKRLRETVDGQDVSNSITFSVETPPFPKEAGDNIKIYIKLALKVNPIR